MSNRQKIVVLSGAGISAESGIRTFRDNGGLWEEHRVEEVATPEAWQADPELVLRFYNQRRAQLDTVEPNAAHLALAAAEEHADIQVITQNVDDLHERAGSSNVLHLHGELRWARSSIDPSELVELGSKPIQLGDLCSQGGQLRPHIVWFGESVPALELAFEYVAQADTIIVVGTSMQVYPAALLAHDVPPHVALYVVDPAAPEAGHLHARIFREAASSGVPKALAAALN